jgi:nucleoside-diphosphate-sugar epimerase
VKALVTGASGFLGRRVVRRLVQEGIAVRALSRPGRTLPIEGVETFVGDLTDPDSVAAAVEGMDWVVHAGARVETSGSWEEFAEANVRGTQRVIRAARAAGVDRIVHVSSLSVYAVVADGVTVTEEDAYESEANARGFYSRSKLAADRLALFEAAAGSPVVVLRPGLLYGPGRRPSLARQSRQVNGVHLLLARSRYLLPLAFVDNVADAVLLAARAPQATGKAFTIVDENIEQAAYLALYRQAAGEDLRTMYLPVPLVVGAALVLERALRLLRRRSPITPYQVRRATDAAFFDCTRAREVLGWTPRVSVREGLRRTFAVDAETGEGSGVTAAVGCA